MSLYLLLYDEDFCKDTFDAMFCNLPCLAVLQWHCYQVWPFFVFILRIGNFFFVYYYYLTYVHFDIIFIAI